MHMVASVGRKLGKAIQDLFKNNLACVNLARDAIGSKVEGGAAAVPAVTNLLYFRALLSESAGFRSGHIPTSLVEQIKTNTFHLIEALLGTEIFENINPIHPLVCHLWVIDMHLIRSI